MTEQAMNRRSFLATILAACVAPAIVRADSLMRIVPNDTLVLMDPDLTVGHWTRPGIVNFFIEQGGDTIGCDLLTTAWRYSAAELQLELPPTIAHPCALRLDGRDVPMPADAIVEQHPTGLRMLHIPRLDLTDYGNRVPTIEVGDSDA